MGEEGWLITGVHRLRAPGSEIGTLGAGSMAAAESTTRPCQRDFRRKSVLGVSCRNRIWEESLRAAIAEAPPPRPRKGKQLSPSAEPSLRPPRKGKQLSPSAEPSLHAATAQSPSPTPRHRKGKPKAPHRRPRSSRGSPPNKEQPLPELTPEAERALLLERAQLLKMERKSILERVAQIKIVPQPRHIPKTIIIAFVDAIEKAHQYFQLKECLRDDLDIISHDSTLKSTLDALVNSHEMENRFYKLDDDIIRHTINTRIKELKDEEQIHMQHKLCMHMKEHLTVQHNKMPSEVLEELKYTEGMFPYLTHSHFVKAIEAYLSYLMPGDQGIKKSVRCEAYVKDRQRKFYMELYWLHEQQKVDHALLFPPYNLVFEAREKAYIMDQNAEAELEKMLKSKGWCCLRYFYYQPENFVSKGKVRPVDNFYCKPRTVKVSNVSLDISEEDIKEFFTFNGDVEYVEMQSGDDQSQIAYVTFGYSGVVDKALELSGRLFEGLTVGNRPVIITAAPDYQLPDSPAATMFQAKHVNAAERPKDVFRSLLAKALEKYTELKTYYSQLPLKDGSNEMFYKTVKKYPALDSYVPDFVRLVHAH